MKTCWIFDVDGVITDPVEKKIVEPDILVELRQKLLNGDILALNTGRSISWMMDRVIKPLEDELGDKTKLSNFIGVGEKGGEWVTYANNSWKTTVDTTISIPRPLQEEVESLINNSFSDSMFYDKSKNTMISTEMIDGFNNNIFSQRQIELEEEIKQILSKDEYKNLDLKIDPTQIATDIQNLHTGKHLGARRIEEWMSKKGLKPDRIFMFGDSQSDSEMVEELQENYPIEFVFVNDPKKLNKDKIKCKIYFTNKSFSAGTLEFLSQNSQL